VERAGAAGNRTIGAGMTDIMIASAIDGRHACYVAFFPATSSLLLVDDAGNAGGPFQGMVLPATGR